MKLWIINRRGRPWGVDAISHMVIRAESHDDVRRIAAENAGGEPAVLWLSHADIIDLSELCAEGDEGVILATV